MPDVEGDWIEIYSLRYAQKPIRGGRAIKEDTTKVVALRLLDNGNSGPVSWGADQLIKWQKTEHPDTDRAAGGPEAASTVPT